MLERFFSKNTPQATGSSSKNETAPLYANIETQTDPNLIDFLEIEGEQNKIRLAQEGLPSDITTFFDTSALSETPAPEENLIGNEVIYAPDTEKQSDGLQPESQKEVGELSRETCPQSESELLDFLTHYFEDQTIADNALFQVTQETLAKRGVPIDQMPAAMEHLFANRAQKVIEQFKGAMKQQLFEEELSELEAESYIYWRLNEFTQESTFHIMEDDMLNTNNFVSDRLLTLFHAQESDTHSDHINEPITYDSEKIDQLLDDIHKL